MLDALVTPVGGGGLMAGCSTVARALRPEMTIIGVEADTANDTYLSLQKGERVTIPPPPTIADGIRITTPGALTFPILQSNRVEVVLVTDDEIRAAVRALALGARIVAEPTGAVGAAAVLAGKLRSAARGPRRRRPFGRQYRPAAPGRHCPPSCAIARQRAWKAGIISSASPPLHLPEGLVLGAPWGGR